MKSVITFLFILTFHTSHGQGPFMGITIGNPEQGLLGARLGTTIANRVEAYAMYHPQLQKFNNPGYYGLSVKYPFNYFSLSEGYESMTILSMYVNYTGGMIHVPKFDAGNSTSTAKKFVYGHAPAVGVELMRFGKFSFSVPLELGFGRMHFNQTFKDQTPDPVTGYTLQSSIFLMAGFKFFISSSKCDEYIQNL